MTVLQSTYTGFATPRHAASLPHYLFSGILTYPEANVMSTQGFQLNAVECTFWNCDSNANSYFAFFPEALSILGTNAGFLSNCMTNNLQRDRENDDIPARYRFQYEAHFGGCGTYVTSPNINSYEAGNIGLWFSYGKNGKN